MSPATTILQSSHTPVPGESVGTELPFLDRVRGLDPGDRGGRRMERLEALHGPRHPLDEAKILFKNVDEVFELQNRNGFPGAGA